MGKRNFSISRMYCCKCHKEGLPIARKSGQYRKAGHLKKLYCIHCNEIWNHVEIHSSYDDYTYEDFELEVLYGNFDENGNRKEPYRVFRGKLKQKGVI